MSASQAKFALGLAALSFILAAGSPSEAAAQMGGEPDATAATPEQMDGACQAVAQWMQEPGLAALLQEPGLNAGIETTRNNIQSACNFPKEQWAKMPDTAKLGNEAIGPSVFKVCNNIHGLIHGGSIGILGVLGGGADRLDEGHQIFHSLCMGGEEDGARPDAGPEGQAPGAPKPATPEQVAAACKRIESALDHKVPGMLFMFKGSDSHPGYNPQYVLNGVASSCGNAFVKAVEKAQKPVFKTPYEAEKAMVEDSCRTFESIIVHKDKKTGAYDPDRAGMLRIVTNTPYTQMAFGYSCGQEDGPPADMPVPPPAQP